MVHYAGGVSVGGVNLSGLKAGYFSGSLSLLLLRSRLAMSLGDAWTTGADEMEGWRMNETWRMMNDE
jgi:hypothetical protein